MILNGRSLSHIGRLIQSRTRQFDS